MTIPFNLGHGWSASLPAVCACALLDWLLLLLLQGVTCIIQLLLFVKLSVAALT